MDRPRPLRELAARAGSSLPRTLRTLNTLVDRGWLVRELPPASHLPPVTVVVPSYRRPGALRRCVRALRAIDYPYLSIVVVDDASDPPLAPAVADLEVAVVRAPRNGGPGTARAIGVEAAGDAGWLAFVDDDCRPSPHWLKRLGAYFDEPYLDVVGGRTRGAPAETPTERYEAVRSSLDMGSVGGPVGPGHPVAYLPTTNLCVRRAAFDAVGGFSVGMRYGEDVDLIWRILSRGGRASYEPRAEVQHDHPRRLAVMLGRRIAYASSEADLSRRHPEAARRWFVPRTTALALASLAAVPRPVGLALGAGVLASIIHETLRKRDRLRRLGVPTSTWEVARAVAREHGASAHHLAEATWRYYSLPLAAAATASPALRRATLPLAALGLALDPRRQRASLSSLTYGALYAAEMSAYQLGVWRGCLHHGSFSPLLPKVRFR